MRHCLFYLNPKKKTLAMVGKRTKAATAARGQNSE